MRHWRRLILRMAIALLALAGMAGSVSAGSTHPAGSADGTVYAVYLPLIRAAGVVQPPTGGGTSANFFLPNASSGAAVRTGYPSIAVDAQGGIHAVYAALNPDHSGRRPAYYAYCPANCSGAASFRVVSLGYNMSWAELALDPLGHPRVLLNLQAANQPIIFAYAACDANCTSAASWTLTPVTQAQRSIRINRDPHQTFALDPQGRPRFVYYSDPFGADSATSGTFFVWCDANCNDSQQWFQTKLSDAEWIAPALAIAPNGEPRIAFAFVDYQNIQGFVAYVECDQTCSSWQGAVLGASDRNYYDPGSVFALRLTRDGRPRLAIQPWQAYSASLGLGILSYMACDANCASHANWSAADIGLPQRTGEMGVDLQLDAQDRPRIVYREIVPREELGYAWCDAGCETSTAAWRQQEIPSTAAAQTEWPFLARQGCGYPQCDPPIPACTAAFWDAGYTPALALDPAGNPRIAFDLKHWQSGGGCPADSDVRWSRFASFQQP